MGKYCPFKIGNYYLYYTSKCFIECFHAHASDRKLTESGSAKFWISKNGKVAVANKGRLRECDIKEIVEYIKVNYKEMFKKWVESGGKPEFKLI